MQPAGTAAPCSLQGCSCPLPLALHGPIWASIHGLALQPLLPAKPPSFRAAPASATDLLEEQHLWLCVEQVGGISACKLHVMQSSTPRLVAPQAGAAAAPPPAPAADSPGHAPPRRPPCRRNLHRGGVPGGVRRAGSDRRPRQHPAPSPGSLRHAPLRPPRPMLRAPTTASTRGARAGTRRAVARNIVLSEFWRLAGSWEVVDGTGSRV